MRPEYVYFGYSSPYQVYYVPNVLTMQYRGEVRAIIGPRARELLRLVKNVSNHLCGIYSSDPEVLRIVTTFSRRDDSDPVYEHLFNLAWAEATVALAPT